MSAPPVRRPLGKLSRRELLPLAGAAISALATTMLLFGRLTPLDGKFGFVVVAFLVFLATYTVLVSLTEGRPAVVDRLMTALLAAAAVTAIGALFSVIVFVFIKGWKALTKPNFYVNDLSVTGPQEPLTSGGILHAIVGTLIMTMIALVITVPLGVACSVFLNESKGRAAMLVRTVVTAMTALPSILAGLFIFATWILILGQERSGLAAAIAMSIMMLPIIIRSADVVLRLVPGNLREAAAALGAPQWRTVWHVVLPTARSGLTTSVILGVARGVGETAPVLLTAGYTATMNLNPLKDPMVSLPLAAYELVRSPQETLIARGFGTAAVLMVLVLVLFTLARIVGGRPAGRLSKGQARRATAKSAADLARFEARQMEVGR
ncbi:MAG: phosphate ABC transporter permease PstA [Actinobacteria bacterium]|nr:phosphate ABC transporter permease PstA [Actinomycetota bacterium]